MSQSTFVEAVSSWSPEECQQQLHYALPKLLIHLQSAETTDRELEIVKVVCENFVPCLPIHELEDQLFCHLAKKVIDIFDRSLEGIIQQLSEESSKQNITDGLTKLLEICVDLVLSLEICVKYLQDAQDQLTIAFLHSLQGAVLHLVHASYSHCKESNNIYGNWIAAVSEILSTLFRKAHSLQMALIGVLDKLCVSAECGDQDIEDMCAAVQGLYSLGQVAAGLDVKIMVTLWKAVSRLACQYKALLCNHLDVAAMIETLCKEAEESYTYLLQLVPQQTQPQTIMPADQKTFSKQVKVLGFYMKVLVALVKEYSDYLLTSPGAICRLILAIQSGQPPCLGAQHLQTQYIDEIQKQVVVALEPLISYLIPNSTFMQCLTATKQDVEAGQKLPLCLTQITVMDMLPNYPEETQAKWVAPIVHPEDVEREPLLAAVFLSFQHCYTETWLPVHLPAVMCHGKPQRQGSLYEHVCTHLCSFVGMQSSKHFHIVESCLLKSVVSGTVQTAALATDVWCFMARYGTADLCYEHCHFLASLVSLSPSNHSIQWRHLVALLRRLVKFLAQEHQAEFVHKFPPKDNISLWSKLPLTAFSGTLMQQIVEALMGCCTKTIHNWLHCKERTMESTLSLAAAIECLSHIYHQSDVTAPHKSTQQHSVIKDKCCHLWSTLATVRQPGPPLVQHVTSALLRLSACLLQTMDSAVVLQILKILQDQVKMPSLGDQVKLAMLVFFKVLGKQVLPPTAQQAEILHCIPKVFSCLLGSSSSVVHQEALQVFAKFAEETAHESIVQESLQESDTIQQAVVAYLNQVPCAGDISREQQLQQQREVMVKMTAVSPQDMYTPAAFNPHLSLATDLTEPEGPAQKRPRTEDRQVPLNSAQEVDQQWQGALRELVQATRSVHTLSATTSVPTWAHMQIQEVHAQLSDILNTTVS